MNCRNCDSTLSQEQNFCSICGEITHAQRLTVTSIVGLFFSNLLSYDNKFLKTFKNLTTKPDDVIDSYIYGFRRKYVNVISYLGLAITLIGIQFFVLRRFFPELLIADSLTSPDSFKVNNEVFDMNVFLDSFYEYQGLLTVMLIPIYAIASRVLFFDSKKYNLAEHFVINMYTNAHFFIIWFMITMLALPLNINYNLFSQISILPMIVYVTYTFKKLYSIKTIDAVARVILYFIIISVITITIFIVVGIIYGIYLGATNQITPLTIQ